jgi:YfiH family protein
MIYHDLPTPYYTFKSLDAFPELVHAVFTRRGGVSPPPWDSLNLGWTVGDDFVRVDQNYRRIANTLGFDRDDLVTTWQVHGNTILLADADRPQGSLGKADGLITNTPGIPLLQRYADCTPILLYDPEHRAAGIAHAGWQGVVNRTAEAAVRAMEKAFGSDPAAMVGAIGPAIGPCCYEVGPEVVTAIRNSQRDADDLLRPSERSGHAFLDLWQANARQLQDAGVGMVEIAGLCTACHTDIFFSHRGDKGKSGRFGAVMMLKQQ